MNKDQIKGRVDEVAGKVQKNLGDAVDSKEQEAKGMAREQKGKVQKTWGDAKADTGLDRDAPASDSTVRKDR